VESVALDLLGEFAGDRVRKLGVRVSKLDFAESDQATLGGFDASGGGRGTAGGDSGADRDRESEAQSVATDGEGGKLTDWVGGEPNAGDAGEADETGDRPTSETGDGQASLGDWS